MFKLVLGFGISLLITSLTTQSNRYSMKEMIWLNSMLFLLRIFTTRSTLLNMLLSPSMFPNNSQVIFLMNDLNSLRFGRCHQVFRGSQSQTCRKAGCCLLMLNSLGWEEACLGVTSWLLWDTDWSQEEVGVAFRCRS